VSRIGIGDETREETTADDEFSFLDSFLDEIEPYLNSHVSTNFPNSNMNENEPNSNGKTVLTQDKGNVEAGFDDVDNVAAFHSMFNQGDSPPKNRCGSPPSTGNQENQTGTVHKNDTVSLTSCDVQPPTMVTEQSSVSFNNISPAILISDVSPVTSYVDPNASFNIPATTPQSAVQPMGDLSNVCYHINGNDYDGFYVQPTSPTQVQRSISVDSNIHPVYSVAHVYLPVTHVPVSQPVVDHVSSTVSDSPAPVISTLKRKANTQEDPLKTKKWRNEKNEQIKDMWSEIDGEVRKVENINMDITGKVAVFKHKYPFYNRDPCSDYDLHSYIHGLEKECNEEMKSLKEDKARDSVKRKAKHLTELTKLLKNFQKIKEHKEKLLCTLDKKISGA